MIKQILHSAIKCNAEMFFYLVMMCQLYRCCALDVQILYYVLLVCLKAQQSFDNFSSFIFSSELVLM